MIKEKIYAFDIGGTKSSIGIFDGKKFLCESILTPNTGSFKKDFEYFSKWKDTFVSSQDSSVFVSSAPICVEGIVKKWPNRPYWAGNDINKSIMNLFKTSFVEIKDDCNFAAYGVHRVKNQNKSALYINVGTGVGMGIILFGNIYNGENRFAGELGHITIDPTSKKKCSCGKSGCLQGLISGKRFSHVLNGEIITPSLQRMIIKGSTIFGVVISNIITIFDINNIFLGGGLFKNNLFFSNTCETLLNYEKKFLKRSLNIYNCTFNNWSLIGAAIYGMDKNSILLKKENLEAIFGRYVKKWN